MPYGGAIAAEHQSVTSALQAHIAAPSRATVLWKSTNALWQANGPSAYTYSKGHARGVLKKQQFAAL